MSTLEIRYNDAEMQALAQRMGRVLGKADTRELMQSIGVLLVSQTTRRFELGTGPNGARWEKSLRALREGGQTLVKSTRLRDSIAEAGPVVTDNSVEVGTNVEYAAAHQFGARIPPHVITARPGSALNIPGVGPRKRVNHPGATLPARPFLGVDGTDETLILDLTDTWLRQLLGRV